MIININKIELLKIIHLLTKNYYLIFLIFILIYAFLVRFINLNYNSPFNDEAIYVVVGRLGVFYGDWWSYEASTWMGGSPYIYPTLSSLAYMTGGIIGSRFFSVILGVLSVELIFIISLLLSNLEGSKKFIAGSISAAILAGSSVSIYVGRIATYDMLSFFWLLLGTYFLISTHKQTVNQGKYYFLSSIFFILSFATKMLTVIFIPFLVIYAIWMQLNKKNHPKNYFYWIRYFVLPFLIIFGIYIYLDWFGIYSFYFSQVGQEATNVFEIAFNFFDDTKYALILWIFGSVGMFLHKSFKEWFILSLGMLFILAVHILTNRETSFDKHIYLSIVFISLVGGIGIGNLVSIINDKLPNLKIITLGILIMIITTFWIYSYQHALSFNQKWINGDKMLSTMQSYINSEDKVLTEYGATTVLALYEKNSPINISTFDYFAYNGEEGDKAYIKALSDTYFDYIQLNPADEIRTEEFQRIYDLVSSNLENYRQVYSDGGFIIYQRSY